MVNPGLYDLARLARLPSKKRRELVCPLTDYDRVPCRGAKSQEADGIEARADRPRIRTGQSLKSAELKQDIACPR